MHQIFTVSPKRKRSLPQLPSKWNKFTKLNRFTINLHLCKDGAQSYINTIMTFIITQLLLKQKFCKRFVGEHGLEDTAHLKLNDFNSQSAMLSDEGINNSVQSVGHLKQYGKTTTVKFCNFHFTVKQLMTYCNRTTKNHHCLKGSMAQFSQHAVLPEEGLVMITISCYCPFDQLAIKARLFLIKAMSLLSIPPISCKCYMDRAGIKPIITESGDKKPQTTKVKNTQNHLQQ